MIQESLARVRPHAGAHPSPRRSRRRGAQDDFRHRSWPIELFQLESLKNCGSQTKVLKSAHVPRLDVVRGQYLGAQTDHGRRQASVRVHSSTPLSENRSFSDSRASVQTNRGRSGRSRGSKTASIRARLRRGDPQGTWISSLSRSQERDLGAQTDHGRRQASVRVHSSTPLSSRDPFKLTEEDLGGREVARQPPSVPDCVEVTLRASRTPRSRPSPSRSSRPSTSPSTLRVTSTQSGTGLSVTDAEARWDEF
jgi:hypothetical protein